ncbi:hypothetical protein GCM10007108_12420 [Thermogymnomonas acidicola]|uniref:Uncharacterized protein n=1 Tax=Thermogymnomonas acidicola TaxID=399579 RepID=A0AA37FBD1_9ARCH|nr:hypothetical protein [Thermogymnomonas acidicola]GGM75982.1 hypothetical protein GCM10007108_12420 [Thermogymnomonas acidicola]
MAQLRELERFEENFLDLCLDPEYKEKLRQEIAKRSEPLDRKAMKKYKDKIEKVNEKYREKTLKH